MYHTKTSLRKKKIYTLDKIRNNDITEYKKKNPKTPHIQASCDTLEDSNVQSIGFTF